MPGARIVLECLKRQGVDLIFGLPGGAVLPIYDALYDFQGLRHILVRQEAAAGHAAEGYARTSGRVGVCLVTSGPDATHARFADAVVPSIKLAALREALTRARAGATSDEIKTIIDGFATGETSGPVAAMQSHIDGWFAHDRMQDIVAALQRDGSELAQSTLKTLNEKSPRGMVVTLKLLRLARGASSLEQCLVREYRAALEVFKSDDFREGVRAAVIDKDRNPKWSPAGIEDVTSEMVAPYFAEIGADELVFGT